MWGDFNVDEYVVFGVVLSSNATKQQHNQLHKRCKAL